MSDTRVVAIANGDYAALTKLGRAVPDTTHLIDLLKDHHGFDGVILADLRRGALLDEIDSVLATRALPGAKLILLWTGHGELGPDGSLRLLGRTTDTADDEVATAGRLGAWAARTGATQVLVVVDTCHSGGGVPDALTMADAVLAGRADPSAAWFGVVAAARGDEPARSGAMARELIRLLTEGPRDKALQLRWNAYREEVRGDDLIDALIKEWSEPRHSPQQAATGNAWPMLRNPLHRPRASHAVVEHLLQAARSSATDKSYFTGRERILSRVVAWTRRGRPGLYVLTGPAGSGKSAILGRVVSLSVPDERRRLDRPEDGLDPGESSVDAHLHARGLDPKSAVDDLAGQLGLPAGAGVYDLLAYASRRRADGDPLLVVIDGLDEAGDVECRGIAVQIVEPLAREALTLVGSRDVPGAMGEPGLLALLGTTAETTNLGLGVEDTLHDVRRYVVRRLHGIAATMDPELIADEILRTARAADPTREGPFLLARLVTSQLRAAAVDTSGEGWQTLLASSVEAALEADLGSTILTIGGREHPTAARELLRALACANGNGLPADDVWPAIAAALSPTGVRYTRDDAYALLLRLGRHVVVGTAGNQAVYRVAHQRLVDHLRPTLGRGSERRLSPLIALPAAEAVAGLYEQLLDEGQTPQQHAYLWRHMWRHLADAGLAGLDLLRRFVARDRESFLLDLAMAVDLVAVRSYLDSAQDAVALHEESVLLRRELADPLLLAVALFELAMARAIAGDADGADDAATEASDLARQAHDDPASRQVLTGALTAQALTQLRSGNPTAAERIAVEAIALVESARSADRPELAYLLSSASVIAANAAISRGDVERANEMSQRAITSLDESEKDGDYDLILLDALATQARVEQIRLVRTLSSGGAPDPQGSASAGRIAEYYHRNGATGGIADVIIAEGLRLLAVSTWIDAPRREPDPAAPTPVELLDEAVELVSPIAEASLDAAVILAASLALRARFASSSGSAQALADLDLAERHLRRFPTSNPILAAQLGQTINMQVFVTMATGAADLPALIERQKEAVNLLDVDLYLAWDPLIQALNQLVLLHTKAGQIDDAGMVRESMIDVLRNLVDGSLQPALRLAATMSDVAAAIFPTRPIEAIDYATEGLAMLEPFEDAGPLVRFVRGACELSCSAARLRLEQRGEARESVERAIELLDADLGLPMAPGALGIALVNATLLDLAEERNEIAVQRARRAVELLEEHGEAVHSPAQLPLARTTLGRALRAVGDEADAARELDLGIAELRAISRDDEQHMPYLAAGLDAAGPPVWDAVLADLRDQPTVALKLSLQRLRPPAEIHLTVRTMRDALAATVDDAALTRQVHEFARTHRARDLDGFDAAWTAAAGEIPHWLPIDPALTHLLIAWWNTPTWQRSRDYLLANPALLDPATDVLLEELRSTDASDDLVNHHLRLRADALAHGTEAAYAPILAAALIDDWMDSEDGEAFLAEHYDGLLGHDATTALAERRDAGDEAAAGAIAVLVLTRRAEQATAFQVLDDAEFGLTLLQPAWRSADVERLAALATLCLRDTSVDDPRGRLATVALAIATALRDGADEAVRLASSALAEVADADERGRLVAAVSDALAFQPEGQDELVRLLRAMRPTAS